jgi:hypothetical protein
LTTITNYADKKPKRPIEAFNPLTKAIYNQYVKITLREIQAHELKKTDLVIYNA